MADGRKIFLELIKTLPPVKTKSVLISYAVGDDATREKAEYLADILNHCQCEAKLINFASLAIRSGVSPMQVMGDALTKTDFILAIGSVDYAKQFVEAKGVQTEKGFNTFLINQVVSSNLSGRNKVIPVLPLSFEGTDDSCFPTLLSTLLPYDFVNQNYFEEVLALLWQIHSLNNEVYRKLSNLLKQINGLMIKKPEVNIPEKVSVQESNHSFFVKDVKQGGDTLPTAAEFNTLFKETPIKKIKLEPPGMETFEHGGAQDKCFQIVLMNRWDKDKVMDLINKTLVANGVDEDNMIGLAYTEIGTNVSISIPMKYLPLLKMQIQKIGSQSADDRVFKKG